MKRIATIVVAVAVLVSIGTSAAVAQEEAPEPVRTTSTTLPGAVSIGDRYSFTGAVIDTPGQPPRTFDAVHAATFIQSFFAWMYYGEPEVQTPPDGVPVSRVDVTGNWANAGPGITSAYYATDGNTVWVSFPKFVVPYQGAPEAYQPAPPDNWFTAPNRVSEAFNGTAELVETAGVVRATTPRDTTPVSSPGSDSGSSAPWIIAAVVVVVVIALLVMRRRRGVAGADDDEVREPVPSGKG